LKFLLKNSYLHKLHGSDDLAGIKMKTVNILVEALPYIKKFHKKKIMIKYGGHAMIDENAMESTARDTVLLKYVYMVERVLVYLERIAAL